MLAIGAPVLVVAHPAGAAKPICALVVAAAAVPPFRLQVLTPVATHGLARGAITLALVAELAGVVAALVTCATVVLVHEGVLCGISVINVHRWE